ncbi:hypothetical protein KYY02_25480 [Streptomyces pimonensis]|uniref:Uncharacterized protein n=1 Tax=Streptomyces pimonensis TaxID=2860288 RepID=A0ABV4J8E9_9ACTN
MLRDADFDDVAMVRTRDDAQNRRTVLVNGRPWPYLRIEARRYRFRPVGSCNPRIVVLELSDGSVTQHPVQRTGTDGDLLRPHPARPGSCLAGSCPHGGGGPRHRLP